MSLLIPVCRKWYKKKVVEYLKDQFKVKVFHSPIDPNVVDGDVVDQGPSADNDVHYSDGKQFEAPLPIIDGSVKSD